MLSKLLALFKHDRPQQGQASAPKKTEPNKIEATHTGELSEHKINIQLDQLPKECI